MAYYLWHVSYRTRLVHQRQRRRDRRDAARVEAVMRQVEARAVGALREVQRARQRVRLLAVLEEAPRRAPRHAYYIVMALYSYGLYSYARGSTASRSAACLLYSDGHI